MSFWSIPIRIQNLPGGASARNGFHPRIDIGKVGFNNEVPTFQAVVAYTSETYQAADSWHVWLVRGSSQDWPFGGLNTEWALPPNNDYPAPGGLPTLDIGPPTANYFVVAWTQCRQQSWNDVEVVAYDNRNGTTYITPSAGGSGLLRASASPSVSVFDSTHAMLSYLYTQNPNSMPWRPWACVLTHPTGGQLGHSLDQHIDQSDSLNGEYDSGSAYTSWYGMGTATVADANGSYWSLWSTWYQDTANHLDGLKEIWGIYGFPE